MLIADSELSRAIRESVMGLHDKFGEFSKRLDRLQISQIRKIFCFFIQALARVVTNVVDRSGESISISGKPKYSNLALIP